MIPIDKVNPSRVPTQSQVAPYDKNIDFLQINRQKIGVALGYANEQKIKVLLIQEYYHPNDKAWGIPSTFWQVFTSTNQTAAIIITRPDVPAVTSYSEDNAVFINVSTTKGHLTIGSHYSRHKGNLLSDMKWVGHFDPIVNLILLAELNAHLPLLGYLKEDERGSLLTYLLLTKDLILINDTESPQPFVGEINRRCATYPDVTLCSQDISGRIQTWFVEVVNDKNSEY